MTADLRNSLALYRSRIDARLEQLLPQGLVGHVGLGAAMRDGILTPGKRIRPLMTMLAAEDLGGEANAALDAGCAVEMVHAASLVVDDLPCMDDAKLRRGIPTVHIGHGEDVAVLVAIGALSAAYGVIAGIEGLAPAARLQSVAILSSAVGVRGLVGGQFADLREGRNSRAVADVATVNGLKTGVLFCAAVEIGGVVAGAGEETRSRLRAFAGELGAAFQLLDDLIDSSSDASAIGKDVGKDKGKSTIVALLGRSMALHRIERHVEAARQELGAIFGRGCRLEKLVDMIFDQALGSEMLAGVAQREAGFAHAIGIEEVGQR